MNYFNSFFQFTPYCIPLPLLVCAPHPPPPASPPPPDEVDLPQGSLRHDVKNAQATAALLRVAVLFAVLVEVPICVRGGCMAGATVEFAIVNLFQILCACVPDILKRAQT